MAKLIRTKIIPFKQGDINLIFFCLSASDLWKSFSINRRVENKDEGYQRILSSSRVSKIAKYIDNNNSLPLNILVSLEKGKYEIKDDELILKNVSDVGWIIDGQHRVAGAHKSKTDIILPVIALLEIDLEDQINQFVTINREAKGVPSSLYYDLLEHLPIGFSTPAERAKLRATDISRILKSDEQSPFFNRIVVTKSPKYGQISLTTFVNNVSSLVHERSGIIAPYPLKDQVKIIDNYFKGIQNTFPIFFNKTDTVFFKTTGFGALIRAFSTVFSASLKNYSGFMVTNITEILDKVNHFNFSNWNKIGTGHAAVILAADDLITELKDVLRDESGESTIKL